MMLVTPTEPLDGTRDAATGSKGERDLISLSTTVDDDRTSDFLVCGRVGMCGDVVDACPDSFSSCKSSAL